MITFIQILKHNKKIYCEFVYWVMDKTYYTVKYKSKFCIEHLKKYNFNHLKGIVDLYRNFNYI